MKKIYILALFLLGGLSILLSCSKDDDSKAGQVPTGNSTLTTEEINGLKFMREEEKLARDVYLKLYETFPQQIFTNIAASEQTHMDTILSLLNKYDIADPATPHEGVFQDQDLQTIYDDLVVLGTTSLLDAMMVGAQIEELDIRDLRNFISKTDKVDIISAYEFLQCGSRNHLRSFDSQVQKNGGTYKSEFITQKEYDDIASGSHEKCGN